MGSVSGRACERCWARRCIDSIGQMIPEKKKAGMKRPEDYRKIKEKIKDDQNRGKNKRIFGQILFSRKKHKEKIRALSKCPSQRT